MPHHQLVNGGEAKGTWDMKSYMPHRQSVHSGEAQDTQGNDIIYTPQ